MPITLFKYSCELKILQNDHTTKIYKITTRIIYCVYMKCQYCSALVLRLSDDLMYIGMQIVVPFGGACPNYKEIIPATQIPEFLGM